MRLEVEGVFQRWVIFCQHAEKSIMSRLERCWCHRLRFLQGLATKIVRSASIRTGDPCDLDLQVLFLPLSTWHCKIATRSCVCKPQQTAPRCDRFWWIAQMVHLTLVVITWKWDRRIQQHRRGCFCQGADRSHFVETCWTCFVRMRRRFSTPRSRYSSLKTIRTQLESIFIPFSSYSKLVFWKLTGDACLHALGLSVWMLGDGKGL